MGFKFNYVELMIEFIITCISIAMTKVSDMNLYPRKGKGNASIGQRMMMNVCAPSFGQRGHHSDFACFSVFLSLLFFQDDELSHSTS